MANAFAHIELTTSDRVAAKKFYKSIFDWKLSDMPQPSGITYTMIDVGKKDSGGGIQAKPMPEAPTAWMPYIEVASVARTTAKVQKLGGKVIVPPMSIGPNGSMAIVSDPQGATFGIWEAPKKAAKKPAKKAAKKAPKKK